MRGCLNRSWRCWAVASALVFVAVTLNAGSVSTDHLQRAVALLAQGDLEGAEQEARLAEADPLTRPVAWATLGAIRFQQKKLDESIQYLQKAIQDNPDLLGARLTLGQAYALQEKPGLARLMFQQVLDKDPNNPAARMNLAQLEAAAGNYKSSLAIVEPVAAALRGSPDGLLLLLVNNLELGRKDAAGELVSDWMALIEEVPASLAIEFADVLAKKGLAQEAVNVLEKAKGAGSPSFELAFALGGAHLAKGNLKRASEYYEQALALKHGCIPCLRLIAKIAEREGEKEKALAYLIKAKLAEPDNPDVLFDFGRICLERNLFRDGIPALEKAVQLRPDNDRYLYVLATGYGMKLRFKESLEIFHRLLAKNPQDSILNYAVGSVLYIAGDDLDGAEKYLRESIRLQPAQLAAYYYLGMVVFKKGDQDQAAAIFEDLLRRYPDHLPSLEQFGTILVKQKKYAEAQQVLEKVLRLDPDSRVGHYQYSLLLARLGRREESAKHMKVAQQLEEERKKTTKMELYLLNPH